MMGFLTWVVLGLIVGILAKWIMPGKDGGGFFMTVILGVMSWVTGILRVNAMMMVRLSCCPCVRAPARHSCLDS